MPTYQYACTACEHELEAVQKFTDDALTECPACTGRLRKVFSAVGVVFKGSGFYRNDSRAGAGAKAGKGGDGKSESTSGESKGSEPKGGGSTGSGSKSGESKSGGTASGGSSSSSGGSSSAGGSSSKNSGESAA